MTALPILSKVDVHLGDWNHWNRLCAKWGMPVTLIHEKYWSKSWSGKSTLNFLHSHIIYPRGTHVPDPSKLEYTLQVKRTNFVLHFVTRWICGTVVTLWFPTIYTCMWIFRDFCRISAWICTQVFISIRNLLLCFCHCSSLIISLLSVHVFSRNWWVCFFCVHFYRYLRVRLNC